MKKAVFLIVIGSAFLLVGCSGSNNQQVQATKTATQSEEISNVDPLLRQGGFERYQLTDPALYSYLEERGKNTTETGTGSLNPEEQKKIGLRASFRKAYKYNITGSATVISATKIKVSLFSYNGACGPIKIALVNKNSPSKPIATVKEIPSAVDQAEFSFDIPSNLSLIKFDSIGVYCPDTADPVSTAELSTS